MSQPRLPGTVPSPKVAREHLMTAKARTRAAERNRDTAKEAVKELKTIVTDAEAARRKAEDDLEADDSPANDAAHDRAVKAKAKAVENLAGGKRALKQAAAALKTADDERGRADEELQAAREGRRRDAGKATDSQASMHADDR